MTIDERGITLRTARGPLPGGPGAELAGVLVIRERLDQGTVSQAFEIRATAAGDRPVGVASLLLAAVGLALAGGLILNLMPCVLPVLSVKVIALLGHADAVAPGAAPPRARLHRRRARVASACLPAS